MPKFKKTIIYIYIILLILIGSFATGYYTNDYYAKKRDSEYTERIDNLEGELKSQDIRNRELTEGLRVAKSESRELTSEITELTEEHKRFVDSLGNLGSGISEDVDRVSNIIDRLNGYIKQSE